MPSFLTWIGSLLMLHAAFSCLHYRSILSDLDLDESTADADYRFPIPPMDVVAEVGIAFFIVLLGELATIGSLQPVEVITTSKSGGNGSSKQRRPFQAPAYRSRDFDIYAKRGKGL
jgi:hypothetical protein